MKKTYPHGWPILFLFLLIALAAPVHAGGDTARLCAAKPATLTETQSIPHADKAPVLDGALTEEAWGHALTLSLSNAPLNADAQDLAAIKLYPTQAKLLWHGNDLFIAFICEADRAPQATFTQHDDPLYKEDVVEVYLRKQESMQWYAELLANPRGTTLDLQHTWDHPPNYPADAIDNEQRKYHHGNIEWTLEGFSAACTTAPIADTEHTRREQPTCRWITELKIPLLNLHGAGEPGTPVRAGESVWLNLLRYAQQPEADAFVFRQLSLIPVCKGRPHISPMACLRLTLAPPEDQ